MLQKGKLERFPLYYHFVSDLHHFASNADCIYPTVQLIGIGGTIGTALYVQIGKGLLNGGPASLFLAFTIW